MAIVAEVVEEAVTIGEHPLSITILLDLTLLTRRCEYDELLM